MTMINTEIQLNPTPFIPEACELDIDTESNFDECASNVIEYIKSSVSIK
jgi:hypothetical protein